MGYRKRREKKLKWDSAYNWSKSSSEPDLTISHTRSSSSPPQTSRWRQPLPHEFITVDELGFHRRRKPPDIYTRSNIWLQDTQQDGERQHHNKSEPNIVDLVSEYHNQFREPSFTPRSGLLRRATSLKLEGVMEIGSEHQSNYKCYGPEELNRSKPQLYKYPENLNLIGNVDYRPEYRTSYIEHDIPRRRRYARMNESQQQTPHPSESHFKLEGNVLYKPEYMSNFVEFPIEKSHSIPQLASIKFHGEFKGVPEYKERFKTHDNIAKSACIRRTDNLHPFGGLVDTISEYREQFQESIISNEERIRRYSERQDNLRPTGEFSKDVPEYNESFRDYHITAVPERARTRPTHLNLTGSRDFTPEYRNNYVDFPRSRPISKKPSPSLITPLKGNIYATDSGKKQELHFVHTRDNIHEPVLDEVPFKELPEYRRARTNYLIRERSSSHDRKILANEVGDSSTSTVGSATSRKVDRESNVPQFKLTVEDVDSKRKSPKFGRRSRHDSIVGENRNSIRNRTSIVEGNPKYNRNAGGFLRLDSDENQSAFVVLTEPCKQSGWMKPKWYQ